MRGSVSSIEDDGKTFFPPDKRGGENRRSTVDRKEGGEPPDGIDRGQQGNRRSAERRVLRYGLLYTMSGPASEAQDWLDDNCDGRWGMTLEDLDEGLERKTIRVLFELESDKQNFKNMILRGG